MAEPTTPGKLGKKQWYIIAGVGATYVAYRWYESKKSGGSTAQTAQTAQTALGTPMGLDANGNEVYQNSAGQEVDANGNPDTVAALGSSSSGESYANPNPMAGSTTSATGGPQTNEQWTAAVEQDLENIAYDPTTVATAIAQYLSSQPLTPAQVTIIRTAWAYEGRPPDNPNLPIIQQSGTTTTGGGGTTTTQPSQGALKPGDQVNVQVLMQKGMTWQTVADRAGISVLHLQEVNPGHSGSIGDTIEVPVQVKPSGWSASWQSIAQYWGISPQHLQLENPTVEQNSTV
jgi:hypothetical protein